MTLKDLYQAVTGDTTAHQRAIHGRYLKLDRRRRRLIDARLIGRSLRQIADAEAVSHGSVQSAINGAMEAIRKAIAKEPRYNGELKRERGAMQAPPSSEVATPATPRTTPKYGTGTITTRRRETSLPV